MIGCRLGFEARNLILRLALPFGLTLDCLSHEARCDSRLHSGTYYQLHMLEKLPQIFVRGGATGMAQDNGATPPVRR